MKVCKAGHVLDVTTRRVDIDSTNGRRRETCRVCERLRRYQLKLARKLGYSSLAELHRLAVGD